MKDELFNIISGKGEVRYGTIIQAITCYLKNGKNSSGKIKNQKQVRKQEEESLISFATSNELWVKNLDLSKFISSGAEQRVYLDDTKFVIKLNDAIYYELWVDYFHNLLLHNYFFTDTAYEFLGFYTENEKLFVVVKQNFVVSTEVTDLHRVRTFLKANGFLNTRNHDYFNKELGIILEDLHDENVLTNNEILYFIDTVFYISDEFWN
jgi:hypothetical protein